MTSIKFFLCPPFRRRGGILLCTCLSVGLSMGLSVGLSVCVCVSVCLSVCLSVTFLFPINNSRTPWPTFLKLCPHIPPGQQRNPIDQWSAGSNVPKSFPINYSRTPWPTFLKLGPSETSYFAFLTSIFNVFVSRNQDRLVNTTFLSVFRVILTSKAWNARFT